jgi:hypothetical protein
MAKLESMRDARSRRFEAHEGAGSASTQNFYNREQHKRHGNGTFLRTVMDAAARNPTASLLIGAGCVLLLAEKIRVNGQLASTARARANGIKAALKAAPQQVSTAAELIADDLQHVGEAVQEYSTAVGEHAVEAAADVQHRATGSGRQLAQYARSLLKEQPFICAVAGLAFGAAAAALLPGSETENSLLGPASDALKEKLANALSEQYEAAKAEAGRSAQELMWVAAREGLAAVASASESVSGVQDKTREPT